MADKKEMWSGILMVGRLAVWWVGWLAVERVAQLGEMMVVWTADTWAVLMDENLVEL